MKHLAALFLLLLPLLAPAQDCSPARYRRIMRQVDTAVLRGQYDVAINKLQSAKVCQPDSEGVVNRRVVEVFKEVNRQRQLAIENEHEAKSQQKKAEENALESIRQKKNAENAQIEAEAQQKKAEFERLNAQNKIHEIMANDIVSRAKQLDDRTAAFRLLELAHSIDKNNNKVLQGLINTVYFNHDYFYSTVAMPDFCHAFDFSPKGEIIVTASHDGVVRFWDTESNKFLFELKGHNKFLNHIRYSRDGKYVISSSGDSTSILWNVLTRDEVFKMKGHSGQVCYADFSTDGKLAVTCSWDNTAKIWDLDQKKAINTLSGHTFWVTSGAFSPDNKFAATTSRDSTLKLWNVSTGIELGKISTGYYGFDSASFDPDGKHITAIKDGKTTIWDVKTKQQTYLPDVESKQPYLNRAKYNRDNSLAAILDSGPNSRGVRLYHMQSPQNLAPTEYKYEKNQIMSADISPDGKHLILGTLNTTAVIFDIQNMEVESVLDGHAYICEHIKYSALGDRALSVNMYDNNPRVWNTAHHSFIDSLIGHSGRVQSASFSPDGSKIITASLDSTVVIWDANKYTAISTLRRKAGFTNAAFSNDGTRIITASADLNVIIWDADRGTKLITLPVINGTPFSARFLPGDKRVAVEYGQVNSKLIIWDIQSLQEHLQIDGAGAFDFSPDGSKLIMMNGAGTKIWNCETGELMFVFNGFDSEAKYTGAFFHPTLPQILVVTHDKIYKYWIDSDSLIQKCLQKYKIAELNATQIETYEVENYLKNSGYLDIDNATYPFVLENNEERMFNLAESLTRKGLKTNNAERRQKYYKLAQKYYEACSKIAQLLPEKFYLERQKSLINEKK